ncbi:MAG: PEP-CTERM sorting domain-containing protein [Bryobacterales bacterium]|nr:PEP-CTERM sorting domain-containing protein [Bryobacterales bacterium]
MFLLAAAMPASATIIGGNITSGAPGATFIKLPVPFNQSNPINTVGNNTFQSIHLYGFDEDQNIVLGGPLNVDVVPSGGLVLPSGATVASHYIFFDPAGTTSINGTVDFDSDIVAIITSLNNLVASDFLANTGVNYLSPGLRGLESGDSVTISGVRQIRFNTTASTPGDYVRVLTAYSPGAVPEPGTAALFVAAFGFAALRFVRR